ncbi:hypothetical protein TNCV_2891271 [Trichonephila clavipes]|nr:hypothetical protein TNCV_2891271 [Trichonephila clavipes]
MVRFIPLTGNHGMIHTINWLARTSYGLPKADHNRFALQSYWNSEGQGEMSRLNGIRLRYYKRENFENESKQEGIMEKSSKEEYVGRGIGA